MTLYALQVQTGQEEEFQRKAKRLLPEGNSFVLPRRRLSIRKRGKTKEVMATVFPGYVFLSSGESEDKGIGSAFWSIRRVTGFLRFLPSNESIHPLCERDIQLIRHFMSFGEIAEKSKVSFDDNDRIVVHSGPLKGYEGQIVKVDKRKGRAKLRIFFCNSDMLVDLGFELMERKDSGGENGGKAED